MGRGLMASPTCKKKWGSCSRTSSGKHECTLEAEHVDDEKTATHECGFCPAWTR